jgi:hypothetical protein
MRFIYALCLLILFSSPSRALDGLVKCPPGNEALPRVTETPYGAPFTETFAMKIGGRSLAVPLGYLSPGPPREFYRNQPFRSPKGFQFLFWMPDGRMPEVDTYFNVMNRPCEAGRAQADEAAYLVDVMVLSLPEDGPSEHERFDDNLDRLSLKEGFGLESRVETVRRSEMTEYRPCNYQLYWILSAPDAPLDAVVQCSHTTRLPNVACPGDIRFHEDDYAMNIFIPRDSVNGFEQAAWLAKQLIGEWQIGVVVE